MHHRRYLKKDTKEKLSQFRDVLQRSSNWLKEKFSAVSSAEVIPAGQVDIDDLRDGKSLGQSSSIGLQCAEQPEVKNRSIK